MTAEIVQDSVKEIEEWTVFIDFAKLPFKGCETSSLEVAQKELGKVVVEQALFTNFVLQ